MVSRARDVRELVDVDKPHINLALAGDVGSGKRALLSALKRVGQSARVGDVELELRVKAVGHRYLSIESAQRRYALATSPQRMMGPFAAPDIFHDVVRAAHGADALIVVATCFDGVPEHTREQLVAAAAYGVKRVVGFIHAQRGDDVDEATLELRQALVDAGLPGDDTEIVSGDVSRDEVEGARGRNRVVATLLDALDRSLPDIARDRERMRDGGGVACISVDEVRGRPGSWDAIARVMGGVVAEDEEMLVADPIAAEIVRGRIHDLRSGHTDLPLSVAAPGELVLFHVASELEIEGDCQAVLAPPGAIRLATSLNIELTPRPGHVIPRSAARLETCRLYVGHARARAERIEDERVILKRTDVVAARPGMPALIAEDGVVIATGRVV